MDCHVSAVDNNKKKSVLIALQMIPHCSLSLEGHVISSLSLNQQLSRSLQSVQQKARSISFIHVTFRENISQRFIAKLVHVFSSEM